MEGNEVEAPLLGKLKARAPLPIRTGCRDEQLCFIDGAIEGDGAGVLHQPKDKKRDARKNGKERKRKGILSPQNLRYNHCKHKVLNYFMWSVRGQGQQMRIS